MTISSLNQRGPTTLAYAVSILAFGTLAWLSIPARADGAAATLPFSIYAESAGPQPFIPSGYMGNVGAIKLTPDCTSNPHQGQTCLEVQYTAPDGWGGVVWQAPANDWGDLPGGFNLTGAKKLTFWARGNKGGEEVNFLYGLIGPDKKYPDSSKGETGKIDLTTDWKEYSIDLTGKNLTQVKSGFAWVLGAQGVPVTFFLDDIQYE